MQRPSQVILSNFLAALDLAAKEYATHAAFHIHAAALRSMQSQLSSLPFLSSPTSAHALEAFHAVSRAYTAHSSLFANFAALNRMYEQATAALAAEYPLLLAEETARSKPAPAQPPSQPPPHAEPPAQAPAPASQQTQWEEGSEIFVQQPTPAPPQEGDNTLLWLSLGGLALAAGYYLWKGR